MLGMPYGVPVADAFSFKRPFLQELVVLEEFGGQYLQWVPTVDHCGVRIYEEDTRLGNIRPR